MCVTIISTGKQMLDKIQPDSNGLSYGTLPDGSDSTKSQSGEKKEVWAAERDATGLLFDPTFKNPPLCPS